MIFPFIDPKEIAKRPIIITCAQWGARPPKAASEQIKPVDFVLHHMANQNRVLLSTPKEAIHFGMKLAQDCQAAHMDSDYLAPGGASDTGQHFTVTIDGYVFEGRHGSAAGLLTGGTIPMGAQCYACNATTVGMEHEGTYTDKIPGKAQLLTSLTVTAWAAMVWGLDTHNHFLGHRDKVATQCPGNAFYAALPAYRGALHDAVALLKQNWHKVGNAWLEKPTA